MLMSPTLPIRTPQPTQALAKVVDLLKKSFRENRLSWTQYAPHYPVNPQGVLLVYTSTPHQDYRVSLLLTKKGTRIDLITPNESGSWLLNSEQFCGLIADASIASRTSKPSNPSSEFVQNLIESMSKAIGENNNGNNGNQTT